MALNVAITEEYTIRRINDWSININTNQILGIIQPQNATIDLLVKGKILAFVDNHVLANINCIIYALVLGNVNPKRFQFKQLYITYLKTKVGLPNIVI